VEWSNSNSSDLLRFEDDAVNWINCGIDLSVARTNRLDALVRRRWGVIIGAIILGIWMGTPKAVALCLVLIGATLLLPVSLSIPGKLIGMTFLDVPRSISSVLGCAIAMAGSVWALGTILPSN
jgi:hypothetical protein